MMGVYDQAARYMTKRKPAAFFQWHMPRFWAAWQLRARLDTRTIPFPGEPDRECDTVAEFVNRTDPGRRCILDVEFQAEIDAGILERLGEYTFRLRRELRHAAGSPGKYHVIGSILNLTGPVQAGEIDARVAELDDAGLHLKVVVRTLGSEDAPATLARIERGELDLPVLAWVPLMWHADDPAIIEQWKRLAEQEPDPALRADYGGLALVFAELSHVEASWRRALEGWNMQQSPQVLQWQEQAVRKNQQANVMRILQKRFGTAIPADLETALKSKDDPDELKRLFDVALDAASLEAFRAALQSPNGSQAGQ